MRTGKSRIASFLALGLFITVTILAQEATPAPGTYNGEGLSLTFTFDNVGTFNGTITMGERRFPFTATDDHGTLRGSFEADGSKFPFTATSAASVLTFDSDGNTYKLKRHTDNPLAKPKKPNPLAGPKPPQPPPAPAAAPVDPTLGTFTDGDGMTVTISGGSGGVYDVVFTDDDHKTSFKLTSAGIGQGYTGVMEEDGEKIAVTANLTGADTLKVTADGETIEFRRQAKPASEAPPGPPPGPPPAAPLPKDPGGTAPAQPPFNPPEERPRGDNVMPPRVGDQAPAARGAGVWLKPQFVSDNSMLKTNALQLLVPEGWRITGGIGWRQHPQYPAYFDFAVTSADGSSAVTYFADQPCIWFPTGDQMFPPGSSYLGNLVAQPMSPGDYVRAVFTQTRPGAQFGEPQDLPDVAKAFLAEYGQAQGIQTEMRAARVRASYELNGQPTEEDVYCVLVYDSFNAGKPMIGWKPQMIYSFRAPAGRLDAQTPLMQSIASSLKPELPWLNRYAQLKEVLQAQGLEAIRETGRRSTIISKLNDDLLRINREAYETQQKAFNKSNAAWSAYIRGTGSIYDPRTGTTVSAPNGSQIYHQNGTYYYTSTPNDPNVQGMQHVGGANGPG